MKIIQHILLILIILDTFTSCDTELTKTLDTAGKNRTELLTVISHYSKSDSIKLKSARFIIRNLPRHYTLKSIALDSMISFLHASDTVLGDKEMEALWEKLSKNDKIERIPDILHLKASDLIENIDAAVETWLTSPWKDDISFHQFCEFILPYRVATEPFSPLWRTTLKKEYSPLIENETDLVKAFTKIHLELKKRYRNHPLGIPYIAPLKDLGVFGTGSCIQACVYEVAVMRALGIPVTIDMVDVWSNYSQNGHFWCSLVVDGKTYTVESDDSIARCRNIIDASYFRPTSVLEKDYPFSQSFRKRAARVLRQHYSHVNTSYEDKNAPYSVRRLFDNPFVEDVTKEYPNSVSLLLKSKKYKKIYLCIWRTGHGWYPIAVSTRYKDNFVFRNIGDSTIYLPVSYIDSIPVPLTNPLLVKGGYVRILSPDTAQPPQKVVMDRKFPLVGKFIDRWAALRGSRLEGSNDVSFKNASVIGKIIKTLQYRNVYVVSNQDKFRYFRFIAPAVVNYPITELEIYSNGTIVDGKPFSIGIANPERAFDGNRFKILEKATPGYSVGLDFGKEIKVDSIVLFPQNDDNFVIPGNQYDLLYYDDGMWKSLGKRTAEGYSLTYKNVPHNALLRLHCLNGGFEERLFTWENGRQIWW